MNKREKPVYLELIQSIKQGFSVLDPSIQKEIIDFLTSQQYENGGFTDRSGRPDPYYSLFGHWLCLALELKEMDTLLKRYINKHKEHGTNSLIDKLAVLLISADVPQDREKKHSIFSLLITHYRKGSTINFAYHFFLLTLTIDAVGKNKKLYFLLARLVLVFYRPRGTTIPCCLLASLIYAKNKVGLKIKKELNLLKTYNNINGGFKAFKAIENSDMLSTGVSLFVLKKTNFDLRIIKPGCLNFVQQNYADGAFLSGDGDNTKDLEYTFYGLLALGSLS